MKKILKSKWFIFITYITLLFAFAGCGNVPITNQETSQKLATQKTDIDQNKTFSEDVNKQEEEQLDKTTTVSEENTLQSKGELKVHFIDVGQADSILVQQGSQAMLVDGGNTGDASTIKNYLTKQGISELQYFVGTHVHEDHIGSADYIINSFKVGKVYFPKQNSTTKTFGDFVTAVKNKGLKLTAPIVGESFKLGEATVTILAPNSTEYKDANDYSIVLKVSFGNTSFLLTGDAETISEKEMISKGLNLEATVLKVGHHGSESSSSEAFLNKVKPKYAVISVGKENSYGHPSQDVMNRLKSRNIPVYRTDEQGTIVATSNGSEVTFNTNAGSYKGVEGSGDGSTNKIENKTSNSTTSNTTNNKSNGTSNNSSQSNSNSSASKIVYYTPSGKSYHYDKNCRTLSRSKTILETTLEEALKSKHSDPCDFCVH
ncbi:ComEC family competence protein [Clostridium sp. N3C]|uniref:ComEC/Rec2 family competence protein n=1 Tax=Clostridium sp. N3C TaxID=1776758 RepID=UPI00092E1438|nr:ComEC/Rec2 family competence protein [Clostridium sp. N3C]SCN24881.1 ComEC family competence protein [Clostridium sp. N3C]